MITADIHISKRQAELVDLAMKTREDVLVRVARKLLGREPDIRLDHGRFRLIIHPWTKSAPGVMSAEELIFDDYPVGVLTSRWTTPTQLTYTFTPHP